MTWEPVFMTLWFRTVDALWPAATYCCFHAFSIMIDFPSLMDSWTMRWNKPFLRLDFQAQCHRQPGKHQVNTSLSYPCLTQDWLSFMKHNNLRDLVAFKPYTSMWSLGHWAVASWIKRYFISHKISPESEHLPHVKIVWLLWDNSFTL